MKTPQLPTTAYLRELTDQHVLTTIFDHAPITRAELATRTGISKPTVSESVRRLSQAGLLAEAGTQTGRPGRIGTYYQVATSAGYTLAVSLGSKEIRLRGANIFGHAFLDKRLALPDPTSDTATVALRTLVSQALAIGNVDYRAPLAVGISVAGPVDPLTGAVVRLMDSPYPEGLFHPKKVLAELTDATILIDNDVNLAAIAEHSHGAARGVETFAYVHIGPGLGVGLMLNGSIFTGARGLSGELAYLTLGANTDRHALAYAMRDGPVENRARLIGAAIASVCAIIDPELVVLGGPIGMDPALLTPIREWAAELAPVPVPVYPTQLGEDAALVGALTQATAVARQSLLASGDAR